MEFRIGPARARLAPGGSIQDHGRRGADRRRTARARDDDTAVLRRRHRPPAGEGPGRRPAHVRNGLASHTGGDTQDEARAALHRVPIPQARRVRAASRGTLFWRLMSGWSPTRLVRAAGCPAKPAKGQTPNLSLTGLVRPQSPIPGVRPTVPLRPSATWAASIRNVLYVDTDRFAQMVVIPVLAGDGLSRPKANLQVQPTKGGIARIAAIHRREHHPILVTVGLSLPLPFRRRHQFCRFSIRDRQGSFKKIADRHSRRERPYERVSGPV